MDLTKMQRNVLHIIQKYPEAANDDSVLLERYWIEIDGWDEDKSLYFNLRKCSNPGSITRRRRELYNRKLITYTKEAEEMREEAFKNELEAHSDNKAVSWMYD